MIKNYICLNDLPALTLCKSKDFWNPWWMFGVSAQSILLRVSHFTTVQRYKMTGKMAKLWFSPIIGSGQLLMMSQREEILFAGVHFSFLFLSRFFHRLFRFRFHFLFGILWLYKSTAY